MKIKSSTKEVTPTAKKRLFPCLVRDKSVGEWMGVIILALNSSKGVIVFIPEQIRTLRRCDTGEKVWLGSFVDNLELNNPCWQDYKGRIELVIES